VSGQYSGNVGFELLTPVVMKNSVLWDAMQYSLLEVERYLGERSRIYACCPLGLLVDIEDKSIITFETG
jgi:hypothetical protein